MLTKTQYEIIGDIAIRCNDLEYIIEAYTAIFVGAHAFETAIMIAEYERAFWKRKDFFEKLLNTISKAHPQLEPKVKIVLDWIKRADKVQETRNSIVHGRLEPDMARLEFVLNYRGKPKDWTELELEQLREDITKATKLLDVTCDDLWNDLEVIRRTTPGWSVGPS